ncbi:hypothetical protein GKC30_00375 [Pseudodesulfovibrio sp. F-1]|uniref:Uncharacterized protein n=1 Tax=Pseudodesulfovibrio alkaliphilus TaxID=2661613 RepID=A0A7K1KJ58_9BACT|nr:hypothetical protein [Pseudodesulfovibrio alkaliphilus]MUM76085.1 hypothetical protein [Pseudodesulfovibrio alkaliphilus]
MPIKDYAEMVERVQRALGRGFAEEPWMLNMPGRSIACKIDHLHYLAVMPAFVDQLGRMAGMFPDQVSECLVRTGNFITRSPDRQPEVSLTVGWGGRPVTIRAAFVDADFIDRAVRTYGGLAMPLHLSDLRISVADRERVEAFFEGKTPPQALVYF